MSTAFQNWMNLIKFGHKYQQQPTASRSEQNDDDNEPENSQICFILDAVPPSEILKELLTDHEPQSLLEEGNSKSSDPRLLQPFTRTIERSTRKFLQLIDKKRTQVIAAAGLNTGVYAQSHLMTLT